jgi:hypothetical protein
MRTYTIGGQSVMVKANSLNGSHSLNERATCSFVVLNPEFEITQGMAVVVQQDGVTVFGGLVHKPKSSGDILREVSVSCIGFSGLADRRIIAEAYDNTAAGDIVEDFITKYFADEGVIAGDIQAGPVMSRAVFNYDSGDVALNYLSEVTGYYWEIDELRRLNHFDRASYAAPFGLTDTSRNYRNLVVEENPDQYRNRQIVRGSQALSTVQTRSFRGDGQAQAFTVDLPIALVPTIKVNGLAITVGIRGLETGKAWYWQKGDKTVSQDAAGTKLTDTDILTVEYQGLYPLIIVAENPSQIDARRDNEGGTGIYEQVTEAANLDTQAAATQYAYGLLERYGYIARTVTFATYEHGLKAGQLIPIQNSQHNVDGTFLIESVTMRADGDLALYNVKALDGDALGGWQRFFRGLAQAGRKYTIRENEVLVKLISNRDSFHLPVMTDELTVSLHQYRICGQTVAGAGVII